MVSLVKTTIYEIFGKSCNYLLLEMSNKTRKLIKERHLYLTFIKNNIHVL